MLFGYLPVFDYQIVSLNSRFTAGKMRVITIISAINQLSDGIEIKTFDAAIKASSQSAKMDADVCATKGRMRVKFSII